MNIKHVLIVEDSEADQFLSKRTIESYDPNITISQAYDGQEALEIIQTLEQHPDVIFLDINMPVMNGVEFLEEYETKYAHCTIVVMLTTSNQDRDVKRCKEFSCVKNYIIKPLDNDDLVMISKIDS